jgi:hypothetical protein
MLLEKNWLVGDLEVERDRRNRYAYFPSTVTAVRSKYNFQTIQDCQERRNACHPGARKHHDEKTLGGEGSDSYFTGCPVKFYKKTGGDVPKSLKTTGESRVEAEEAKGTLSPGRGSRSSPFRTVMTSLGFG